LTSEERGSIFVERCGEKWWTDERLDDERAEDEDVFHGAAQHTIDAKGRVFLPAKFRPGLAGGLVVTAGPGKRLWIFDLASWPPFVDRLNQMRREGKVDADAAGMVIELAHDTTADAQGRILMPEVLREYAGLDRDAAFVGQGDRIDVWPATVWERRRETGTRTLADMTEFPA
jgi:MraZ protein